MIYRKYFLGYISLAERFFNHFYLIGPESYRVGEITQTTWPLRCSRSFKVTDFSTNRKAMRLPISDNINLPLSCTVSKLWLSIGQIFTSSRGCFTLTPSLEVIPCKYLHKLYLSWN